MKIIKAYPPNFSEIAKVFPVKGRPGIIYAWGDRMYNPSGVSITPWIEAHESVHGMRQADTVGEWWTKYLTDPTFRLEEEVLAHRMEFHAFDNFNSPQETERYLDYMADRLSSPLYGGLVSHSLAVSLITKG